MENIALITLIEELRQVTEGLVVRRIVQHHPNGFLLQTRTVRIPALKISLIPRSPAVYVSSVKPPVDSASGDFLMVLRKHLVSAKLVKIHKPLSERIVEFEFKTALPTKELESVVLVAELLPNAPNLMLLDAERRLVASFNRVSSERDMTDFDEYRYPAMRKRDLQGVRDADPEWFNKEEAEEAEEAFDQDKAGWLIRNLGGFGPVFAAELARRQTKSGQALPDELNALLNEVSKPAETVWLYSKAPFASLLERNDVDGLSRCILSPIELVSLGAAYGVQTFPGMLEATRVLCDTIEERSLLEKAKAPVLRKLRDRKRRLKEQRKRLVNRQQQFEDTSAYQETAQMLVSSGIEMDRCQERVEVTDYTGDAPTKREVELDPTRTVRENVTRMFKKHKKAVRGLNMLKSQFSKLEASERQHAEEEERVRSIGDWNAWNSLVAAGNASPSKQHGGTPGPDVPGRGNSTGKRRSRLMNGHEVLIGRNSRENDEITFRVATGDDFWFHVADYSGSHVIIRNPSRETDLSPELLEQAAQLAAYYSQARNSHKVNVHYTRRKFVKKPRRAKPGLVLLKEFKTISVEPRNWTESGS